MEVVPRASDNGKDLLILNLFKFRKAHTSKEGQARWRCTVKTCKAKVITFGPENIVLESLDVHNHEANVRNLERQLVRSACKRKAVLDPCEQPRKIITNEIGSRVETEHLVHGDCSSIRQAMYRSRRAILPALPKCREDVHNALGQMQIVTRRGEEFLLINDRSTGIVIFSCESNLSFLCEIDKIYIDGTFNHCTKYFTQLFTIHGLENGHYIPLVFCLLPSKKKNCYEDAFKFIESKCSESGKEFKPKVVVADFELAIHQAVASHWPNVTLTGCRFHLAQAWYRNIQKVGLSVEFRQSESETGKWLAHVFGLPLLNPEEVGDCFAFDLASTQPEDDRVRKFTDYLVENYISEESTFPPTLWAEANASVQRTTNACESFHARFNKSFYSSHPNLFIFLESLKNFQVETMLKIRGSFFPAVIHDKKVKKRIEVIQMLINKYSMNTISRLQYVASVSHHYKVRTD